MKFHTKRYDIRRVSDGEGFNEGITHEINLKDGYRFSDGTHIDCACGIEDLLYLISDIEKDDGRR